MMHVIGMIHVILRIMLFTIIIQINPPIYENIILAILIL